MRFTGLTKYIVPASVFVLCLALMNLFLALLLASAVPLISSYLKKKKEKALSSLLEKQFIESLHLVTGALCSGQTLLQSFEEAASRTGKPLSSFYSETLAAHKLGKSLDTAVMETAARYNNEDMKVFGIIIAVMRETGGNTASLLSNMAESAEERLKLNSKLDALTAQGRLSGLIVGILPCALLALFWLLDRGLIFPLFHTLYGNLLLACAAVLELAGMYFISKITEVET